MTDKILVVTAPDDTPIDGIRVLLVELNEEQSQIVSNALLTSTSKYDIITYAWKMGDSVSWLIDKKTKSDIIIFNADATPNGAIELIIGYIAAQPNSYYFGNLKSLSEANDSAIYTTDHILQILENAKDYYDKTR
jgi:hypothetical protein